MAASVVQLCNRALSRLGHTKLIADLEDKSTEAQQCALHFEPCRDEVLTALAWPFATKRVRLALPLDAEGEALEREDWEYVYTVPDDCLVVQGLVVPGARTPSLTQRYPYRLEADDALSGQLLLTDLEDAELVYTARHTAVTRWPPSFDNALAWRLAMELVAGLRKDAGATLMAARAYAAVLDDAGALMANQGQEDLPPLSPSLAARRA